MDDRSHVVPDSGAAATAAPPPPPSAPSTGPSSATSSPDRRVVALVLIAIGVLGVLGNLGLAPALSTLFGFLLFVGLGVVALAYAGRTGNDWIRAAAFPAFGLAIATIWSGDWGGGAFLASLGVGFASLYAARRERWWAVIPAGVLFTIALVAITGNRIWGVDSGVLFFLGLAATFFVLWRLPVHAQPWAVFPAAACAFMAFLVLSTTGGWIVPVLLIAAGLYLAMRSRSGPTTSRT
jgi:hypothetical protein